MKVARRLFGSAVMATVFTAAFGLSGCDPGDAKSPNAMRPIAEDRAVELISKAMQTEGAEPDRGREEPIVGTTKSLRVTVGVQGKRYGVAFITPEVQKALGSAIPPPNRKDELLKLKRLGDDGETHVLLLFQQNYFYDDLAGESHEQTSVSAERAMTRDVRDFMVHARVKAFK